MLTCGFAVAQRLVPAFGVHPVGAVIVVAGRAAAAGSAGGLAVPIAKSAPVLGDYEGIGHS
jgi:hypothetical protein